MSRNRLDDLLSTNLIKIHNIKINLADTIIISIILIMSIIFIQLVIHKHNVYHTYAWDLGTFGQILRSTLEGKFMYHTPYLFIFPNGNYLFLHFTPIILSLLPIYALFPYATTLLIVKPIITFSAIYPLYLISRRLLNDNLKAILIGIIYALYPLLHGALWFDFQHAIFIPLFIFLAEYSYINNRKMLYIISLSLLSLSAEHGALLALISIFIHLLSKYFKFKIFKIFIINYNNDFSRRFMICIFISILIYFIAVVLFLQYVQEEFTIEETRDIIKAYAHFSILNYKGSVFYLPFHIITHPSDAINALKYDYIIKIVFIMLVFGVLLFFPLQSFYGILAFIIITPYLFSNYAGYYTIGTHYPYYYIGVVFLGLITFISKIRSIMRILASIILTSILLLVSIAPWSPFSLIFIENNMAWYPIVPSKPDHRILELDELVKIANNEDLPILVQNSVFPHTTQKPHVYAIPTDDLYNTKKVYFDRYINTLIDKVELILLYLNLDPLATEIYKIARDKGFNIYAYGYNSVLLKRNYTSNITINEDCRNMFFHKESYQKEGIVKLPKGKKGHLVYGPYRVLFEGSYLIRYDLRADSDEHSAIAIVEVVSDQGSTVYAREIVSGYDLKDGWKSIELEFSIREDLKNYIEFRVYSLGNSDLEFRGCHLEKIDGVYSSIGLLATDLSFKAGFKNNYTVTLAQGTNTDIFWYGPKIRMFNGVYLADIYLKIEPNPTDRVIDISIAYDNQSKMVYNTSIDKDSLIPLAGNWYLVRIPFVLDNDVNDLEIIGKRPNTSYEITISHINIRPI